MDLDSYEALLFSSSESSEDDISTTSLSSEPRENDVELLARSD